VYQKKERLNIQIAEGKLARGQLVFGSILLAVSFSKHKQGNGVPFSDLVAEAIIGLFEAAEKFKPQKGRYNTIAGWYIRSSLQKALRTQAEGKLIVSTYDQERIDYLRKQRDQLEQAEGYELLIQDLMGKLSFDESDAAYLLQLENDILAVSLDRPMNDDIEEDRGSEADDYHESVFNIDDQSPEDLIIQQERDDIVAAMLAELPARDEVAIRARYFGPDGPATLEEAGKRLGVGRERMRQRESQALHKLRHPEKLRKLRQVL
jgi:RNA polymerase sigma factor (sigma-70 family)